MRSRTILWATGVRAPDVVASVIAQHGKGDSLTVDEYLQVRGRPEVYAVGDDACIEDIRTRQSVPLVAPAAIQEGAAAAENIIRALEGRPAVSFHYRSLGNAISLGRSAGVVEVGRIFVDGFLGALGSLLIHLSRMHGLRNRLATVLDWGVNYVEEQATARLDVTAQSVTTGPHRASKS